MTPDCVLESSPRPPPADSRKDAGEEPSFDMRVMGVIHRMNGQDNLHNHLDLKMVEAIVRGEYVDFAKLLKQDRPEDSQLQVINQNELTFYVPATKPPAHIASHEVWNQAFMVFQSVQVKYHPHLSGELLEYRNLIAIAAQDYDWERVYNYDKEFRRVMAHTPGHPWNLVNHDLRTHILLGKEGKPGPAFMALLLPTGGQNLGAPPGHKVRTGKLVERKKKCELCRCFNLKNECRFGVECFYDHRCAICGSKGHGASACNKIA